MDILHKNKIAKYSALLFQHQRCYATTNIFLFWYSSVNWKWDNLIGILCKLRAGLPRDCGSTLVRDKRLFTPPTYPEWLWGQTSLQFNIPEMLSLGAKRPVRKTDHYPPPKMLRITLILPRSRTGRYGCTLLPATREHHGQNCTQSH